MVKTLRYKYVKPVHGSLRGKLQGKSAEMRWTYIIHHAKDVYSDGSDTEMS